MTALYTPSEYKKEIDRLIVGRNVLVTGAAGTVGRALVRSLLQHRPGVVYGFDNNESELFFLQERFGDQSFRSILGDVRDRDKLEQSFRGIDVVFHCAALKHVPLCQRYPLEAVQTNILGVQNVIQAAISAAVPRVIYTSSDKAVNPTSVMGASKMMGEQLMAAAAAASGNGGGRVFTATRFGNVLNSRGSVMPLFREQIRRGGPVRLTDRRMTRFVMTLDEAVSLVLEAAALARGGEVFVTKMPVVRIPDLAKVMVEELAERYGHEPKRIEIREVGPRPGEKMYEELMNTEETRRSHELARHFVITPALLDLYPGVSYDYPGARPDRPDRPYNSDSEEPLPVDMLRSYLRESGALVNEDLV